MKRIRLGEFKTKYIGIKSKLFLGLFEPISNHWLYFKAEDKFTVHSNAEFEKNCKVIWSEDLLLQDDSFRTIWDFCFKHLHNKKNEKDFYDFIAIIFKKDQKHTHFAQLHDKKSCRAHYKRKSL